ncbi:MAG: M15 family metallopeptidase [Sideroxyarcus sp.]|nr:M15 family metallopeptidase [Sideroxyarcus sp.]
MSLDFRWMVFFVLALASNAGIAQSCHYQDWRWNVAQQRAVQQIAVSKDAAMLRSDEVDAQSGCTVCAEDQQAIRLDGVPEFSVCRKYAALVRDTLADLIRQGEKIESVIGYRVGRTRGGIDAQGNRTGFSNHSYGIAIDINTKHNGLYGNCVRFGPQCSLLRAGPWRPGDDPYSLQADGAVVKAFKQAGFKWGGEIEGGQKDFMHFSPTGY